MRKKILLLISILLLLIHTGCSQQVQNSESEITNDEAIENLEDNKNQHETPQPDEQDKKMEENSSQDEEIENPVYGTWLLDKVALKSIYREDQNWEHWILNRHIYVGYEMEYTPEYFRLGDEKFPYPIYTVRDFLFSDYTINGDFQNPDLYEFVEKEGIKVDHMDEYENMGDIPLTYILVGFEKEVNKVYPGYYVPIGDQVLLLNENTMLVGVYN